MEIPSASHLPKLSDSTILELVEFETAYLKFFMENAKDPKGIGDMADEAVHREYVHWLSSSCALIGAFDVHGNQALISLIATMSSTALDPDQAIHIKTLASQS